jgi:tetratricopeptide (TPR) repeat protein
LLLVLLGLPACSQPVGARNKYKIARGYFQRGEYAKAVEYFESTIQEDAGYLDAHYMLGLTYFGMENYPKAEEKLTYVIALDPQFVQAYQYLGQVYVAQKKFEAAKKHFHKMSTVPGGGPAAQYCLGVVAYQEKNLAAAEKFWVEAARLDPKDGRSRNNLGVLRSSEGKHGEALVQFQLASKLAPENPGYLVNEAAELIELQRLDQARAKLTRAGKLADTRHDVGFMAEAWLAKLDGKWDAVVNHCDSCLKRNPDYTQAWLLKAQALEHLKKPEEAVQAYTKALESDPNLKEAELSLARLQPEPKKPAKP